MSALLTANQFEKVFPQVVVDDAHPNHATLQSFVVAIYVSILPTNDHLPYSKSKICIRKLVV